MSAAVLADTGPLYAALDPSDGKHEQTQSDIERLDKQGYGVAVTYPTLCEAYSLVLYKLGIRRAHGWLREVRASASLVNPGPDDYRQAIDRVLCYRDQKVSMVDAVTAVVSERLSMPVWAYDHHFDVMRVDVWRTG